MFDPEDDDDDDDGVSYYSATGLDRTPFVMELVEAINELDSWDELNSRARSARDKTPESVLV